MVNEAIILCGGLPAPKIAPGPAVHRFQMQGRDQNVTLELRDITRAMVTNLPPAYLDLLEIATYVYCADQAVTRGGAGVDNMGEAWRRRLNFFIPVREVDLWAGDEMSQALTHTLGFLSDDDYSFRFVPMDDAPPAQAYLTASCDGDSERYQEVALFSGGLDSLGGAIEECVSARKRVAFVSHQPTTKMAARRRRLVDALTARSKHTPLFVPVTVNKAKNLGRETTQRSRSFLYASLAAAVAGSLGLSRIRFYENGIVSINLPPLAQIVGAKATRTTHPRVLRGFEKILSLVAGQKFEVESPFLWLTKADVVSRVVESGSGSMISDTVSCMHTWQMTNQHPHCGSCSQCIGRRLSILAAGAETLDPEDGYKVRLLDGARDDNESRTMVAALVASAEEFTQLSAQQFFGRFGEAMRVLRYVGETADAAALKVHDLHRRHGQQVTGVIDRAIGVYARQVREGNLPATCLLRLVTDSSAAVGTRPGGRNASRSEAAADIREQNYFRHSSRGWKVRYQGGAEFTVPDWVGASFLHVLLSQPDIPVSVAQLVANAARVPVQIMKGTPSDRSDGAALADYQRTATALEEELSDARKQSDTTREAVAMSSLRALTATIEKDRAFRGHRRMHSDEAERARKSVHAGIRRVLEVIKSEDRQCWAHLEQSVKRGWNPCYAPRTPVDWAT